MLIASTSLCKIFRYWIDGPKQGPAPRSLIDELPGNPDNINRASDGTYWLALVGIRTPTFDLAARKPGFRLRMVKQVPTDEWLAPALNHGCVLKFNEAGEVLESCWDPTGISHSTLTSMREHKGYLYLGGPGEQPHRPHQARSRRPDMDRLRGLLGQQAAAIEADSAWDSSTHLLARHPQRHRSRMREQNAIPPLDGALSPNDRLDSCRPIGAPLPGLDDVADGSDGAIYVSAGTAGAETLGRPACQPRTVVAEFDDDAGGLALHPDGRLLVCVAGRGLAAIDPAKPVADLARIGRRPRACTG